MKVLLIDDDISLSKVLAYQLEKNAYRVSTANDGKSGLQLFADQRFDIVISDIRMPDISGIEVLQQVRRQDKQVVVIMITAHGSVENAIEACRIGADDYITKPFGQEQLLFVIEKALRLRKLQSENLNLREQLVDRYQFENMISTSSVMQEILRNSTRVAQSDATVLILGESGTGKELIARGIHFSSPRKEKPFITVNCPSIPGNLLESELFGHVKGAFTGAIKDRKGKFELADGGTIFLDEIGDLPGELQAKLLRVLQELTFEPVGSDKTIKVDVRILAATNRNLEQKVKEGSFREDLYYRLSVVPIELPPLRKRRDEIPYLVDHFLMRHGKGRKWNIAPEVMTALQEYDWPGNVRELENVVERMLALAADEKIGMEDLPSYLLLKKEGSKSDSLFNLPEEGLALEDMERQLIEATLEKCDGNQSKAAKMLKIPRHVLLYRMKKLMG